MVREKAAASEYHVDLIDQNLGKYPQKNNEQSAKKKFRHKSPPFEFDLLIGPAISSSGVDAGNGHDSTAKGRHNKCYLLIPLT